MKAPLALHLEWSLLSTGIKWWQARISLSFSSYDQIKHPFEHC